LDLSLTGIKSEITHILAEKNIPVFTSLKSSGTGLKSRFLTIRGQLLIKWQSRNEERKVLFSYQRQNNRSKKEN
jgi:hypothetical protein